jgi:hypothetical protein
VSSDPTWEASARDKKIARLAFKLLASRATNLVRRTWSTGTTYVMITQMLVPTHVSSPISLGSPFLSAISMTAVSSDIDSRSKATAFVWPDLRSRSLIPDPPL